MAHQYGELDANAERLAAKFWPGPLTLVVPLAAGSKVHPLVTAGLSTIALRAPRGVAKRVIEVLGRTIAAPSANRSGRLSPTRAEHVVEQLGDAISLILDAGLCEVGVESTIISLVSGTPRLLRPGGLAAEAIEAELEIELERAQADEAVAAPGMLASHYAPRLPLRPNAASVTPNEALLAFGDSHIPGAGHAVAVRNLSPSGNLTEAAANLFAQLAELDRSGATAIAVMPIPRNGLGAAINDRLLRAARRDERD
jgi:L-threonylcarbamoyladenylate synthase